MKPNSGDVLVSNTSARIEHEISIVPEVSVSICRNHDSAVARARALARERQVDAWLTEDHTHFLKIASHRPGRSDS